MIEDEGEQIRLPQLIGGGALEAVRRRLVGGVAGDVLQGVAGVAEGAGDGGGAGGQRGAAGR